MTSLILDFTATETAGAYTGNEHESGGQEDVGTVNQDRLEQSDSVGVANLTIDSEDEDDKTEILSTKTGDEQDNSQDMISSENELDSGEFSIYFLNRGSKLNSDVSLSDES